MNLDLALEKRKREPRDSFRTALYYWGRGPTQPYSTPPIAGVTAGASQSISNHYISMLNCSIMTPIYAFRRQCFTALTSEYSFLSTRALSTSGPAARNADSSKTTAPQPHRIDPRWLTMTKRRLGRCMMFGLKPAQVQEAGEVLQQIARDWRELIAGSEGYLTDATRRGLFRQSVAWGEMVGRIYLIFGIMYWY